MITRKVSAALAAGCTVVIKPAAETPLSALAFAELAQRCGFPKGVINVVTTSTHTKEVGEALCSNPLVSKISFTGSTNVGKLLMSISSGTMKKMSLELGGNAPFMVFDDADILAAVEGLISGKFRNAGQTCVCPNRVYVQKAIYEEFTSLLKTRVSKLKTGSGFDPQTDVGPLIHRKALEKVAGLVLDAVSKGATIVCGGKHAVVENMKGVFYAPTIITDLNSDMQLHDEEIFGPIIPIYTFDSEEEGLQLANATRFGLAAYAYTRDIGRAFRVSEKMQSGMVAINSASVSTNCAPFGGVRISIHPF
ncbi:hypothetical protein DSO57_1032088 [Entomophthora muscae]|uniref:Uncharacterized protein n=1 Tax=Entomophthora muscae TaxID=34485 RepID=A0ACC2S2K6_9FUNG|nr:hypothetical protein DSO57_1032088 [Entomophthora muscae]